MTIKVCLWPEVEGEDPGDGGIRRVIEAQRRYLPQHGIEFVGPDEADVLAAHIQFPATWPERYTTRKPFVLHSHGLYWDDYEWPEWALQANREVLAGIRMADVTTVPSRWLARVVEMNLSRSPMVIPHGIDMDEFEPGEDGGYVWWDKTRPDPVCDPEPMNAVATLLPRVRFVSTFGHQAANVELVGRLPYVEARQLTRDASVYLATSKETFGIATLQAMAAGVPVVGYRWGGTEELVTHESDGYLAIPGDVADLARGIEWAIEHRAVAGRRARETARRYGWEQSARRYADLYATIHAAYQARNKAPRTTIVVPAYGLDQYLPATLDSVIAQTDPRWECIVVDDASPDRCGEIADDYASRDSRIRVIHNEQNQYLAGARNTGIAAARGRYVLPLDADDMLAPQAVELLADALDADRTIHVAYGGVRFVDEDGVTPTDYGHPRGPGQSGWPMQFRVDWQLQQRNLLPYCSMYRHEAWQQTGGYRTRCRTAEDADFWTRLVSYGWRPKMVTEAPTLIYRNREGSMSRREERNDWTLWFPWCRDIKSAPVGSAADVPLPVRAFDPPVYSVVIPVGPGHERHVQTAVDSVEAQTWRHWECIVVDDTGGSTLAPLPAWVRVLRTDHGPRGVAHARNVGIAAARGAMFVPLDADDILQPRALERYWQAAETHRGQIIYSDWWEDPDQEGDYRLFEAPDYDPDQLIAKGSLHAVTAAYPRKLWEAVGGYREDVAWEDWGFQLDAADQGVCSVRIAEPLFLYRKHTGRRREGNYESFEDSKQSVIAAFDNRFWEKGQKPMACRKCPKGRQTTITPSGGGEAQAQSQSTGGVTAAGVPRALRGQDLVLLQYTGTHSDLTIRGTSGTRYLFSETQREKWVLSGDAPGLLERVDFARVEERLPAGPVAEPRGDALPTLA